jgi:uncharacterized protein (TIGR02996 family)
MRLMLPSLTLHGPEPLFQAIARQPDRDEPRLRYAAWLDERCDPLGEFIRVQCELARVPADEHVAWELERREQELLAEHEDDWAEPVRGLVDWCVFRRGFIAEAALSAADFVDHAAFLFRQAPLQDVHLRNVSEDLETLVGCPWLERVRHLDLSNNCLRDAGGQVLSRCCHLDRLISLNLSSTALGNAGLQALAVSPHLAALRELYLSDNRIGAGGARALADSNLAEQLRAVHLRFNDFGVETSRMLHRAFGARVQC